jgi:hypothetical protein
MRIYMLISSALWWVMNGRADARPECVQNGGFHLQKISAVQIPADTRDDLGALFKGALYLGFTIRSTYLWR